MPKQWDPDALQIQALPRMKLGLPVFPPLSGLPNVDPTSKPSGP